MLENKPDAPAIYEKWIDSIPRRMVDPSIRSYKGKTPKLFLWSLYTCLDIKKIMGRWCNVRNLNGCSVKIQREYQSRPDYIPMSKSMCKLNPLQIKIDH